MSQHRTNKDKINKQLDETYKSNNSRNKINKYKQ